jgi:hypothetical protein
MSRKRFLITSLLLVACVGLLAACGAGTKASSPATTTSTTTTAPSGGAPSSAAFAKFADCLKQHGVTAPAGGGFGGGGAGGGPPQGGGGARPQLSTADRATFQAAQTACASLRPAGGGGFQRGGGGANSSAFAAYNNCLKLHGVTITPGQRPNTASKKVQTAMTACASLRPAPGSGAVTPPPATS